MSSTKVIFFILLDLKHWILEEDETLNVLN